MKQNLEKKLKSGLILWAKNHDVTPNLFSEKMNYAYPTAWDLLRGKRPFTQEAFGRFILAYGLVAGAEILELARLPHDVESVGILEGPQDKSFEPVLVVQLKPRKMQAAAKAN